MVGPKTDFDTILDACRDHHRQVMCDDLVFQALAAAPRRRLLITMLHDGPQRVPRLSDESREMMDAHESFLHKYLTGPIVIDGADKSCIRMYHEHLPLLAGNGFIEWKRDAHLVTKGPRFDDMRPILELLDQHRDGHVEPKPIATIHR